VLFVAGQTVGSYQILEQLGQGGMATVYKAYHAALDRYVAIKVLHQAFLEDPTFLARFQREARVVARLDHPNIIPIYDFAQANGLPYLVMKYIEGETLKARLERGALSQDEMLQVVDAVGSALNYAHAQGILHRDIKPSNVLLAKDGNIYLADFGLARIAQSTEMSLTSDRMVGTPQYISPEQAMSKADLDARTDIYSFGVMLYEIVVGQVPFNADTPFAVIHDHIYSPLPPPRQMNPAVSPALERVLLKALAKNAQDRFENAASMVRAVHLALQGAPMAEAVISMPVQSTQPFTSPKEGLSEQQAIRSSTITSVEQVAESSGGQAPGQTSSEMRGEPIAGLSNSTTVHVVSDSPTVEMLVRRRLWGWLLLGVVLILAFVVVAMRSDHLRQSARQQWYVTATALQQALPATPLPKPQNSTLPQNLPTDLPPETMEKAQDELDQAIIAYLSGDLGGAKQHLDAMMVAAGKKIEFYDMALDRMMEKGAWGLALWLTIDPPQDSPIDFVRDRSERMHQLVYLAAADPQAAPVFDQQRASPLFKVAIVRRELLFGDVTVAKRQLGQLFQDPVTVERFPEVFLLEAEVFRQLDDEPQVQKAVKKILDDTTMPIWVVEIANQMNKP
jgi:serine/threonine protein kinase